MDILGIGMGEVLLILVLAFIIFGPRRSLEISQKLGKALHRLSRSAASFHDKVSKELNTTETNATEIRDKGDYPPP